MPGRDSGQHSTRVTEPEEGETDANRTERNGFGEKDDEGVSVCILCARVCEYERFGFDTQPLAAKVEDVLWTVLYSVSATEKEEQNDVWPASLLTTNRFFNRRSKKEQVRSSGDTTPHVTFSPSDLPFLSRSPTRMGMMDKVTRFKTSSKHETLSDTRKC